jgi:preprotein translocase subunit SecA
MNSQRKVIYRRRNQILEGADLRDEAVANLEAAVSNVVQSSCVSELPEEWDVEGLHAAVNELYPTALTFDDLAAYEDVSELERDLTAEAMRHYEAREAELGPDRMRQVERQVMLRVIDTRWREHLYEMDYLQDGIHLRAMGQKDPLVEWQREGYAMFTAMVDAIANDFVKYVMHVQVVQEPQAAPAAEVRDLRTSGPVAPEQGSGGIRQAAVAEAEAQGVVPPPAAAEPEVNTPVVKAAEQRVGRNEPCWCGSGKKYKLCHGR